MTEIGFPQLDIPNEKLQEIFGFLDGPSLLAVRRVSRRWRDNGNQVLACRANEPSISRVVARLRLFGGPSLLRLIPVEGQVVKMGAIRSDIFFSLIRDGVAGSSRLQFHRVKEQVQSMFVMNEVQDVVVVEDRWLFAFTSDRLVPLKIGQEGFHRHPSFVVRATESAKIYVVGPAHARRIKVCGVDVGTQLKVAITVDLSMHATRTDVVVSLPNPGPPTCRLTLGGEGHIAQFRADINLGPLGIGLYPTGGQPVGWLTPSGAPVVYCALQPFLENQLMTCEVGGGVKLWQLDTEKGEPLNLLPPTLGGDFQHSFHLVNGIWPGGNPWVARVRPGEGIEVYTFGFQGEAQEPAQKRVRK